MKYGVDGEVLEPTFYGALPLGQNNVGCGFSLRIFNPQGCNVLKISR